MKLVELSVAEQRLVQAVHREPAPAAAILLLAASAPTTMADGLPYGTRWPRSHLAGCRVGAQDPADQPPRACPSASASHWHNSALL